MRNRHRLMFLVGMAGIVSTACTVRFTSPPTRTPPGAAWNAEPKAAPKALAKAAPEALAKAAPKAPVKKPVAPPENAYILLQRSIKALEEARDITYSSRTSTVLVRRKVKSGPVPVGLAVTTWVQGQLRDASHWTADVQTRGDSEDQSASAPRYQVTINGPRGLLLDPSSNTYRRITPGAAHPIAIDSLYDTLKTTLRDPAWKQALSRTEDRQGKASDEPVYSVQLDFRRDKTRGVLERLRLFVGRDDYLPRSVYLTFRDGHFIVSEIKITHVEGGFPDSAFQVAPPPGAKPMARPPGFLSPERGNRQSEA